MERERSDSQPRERTRETPRTQPEEGQTYHTAHRSRIGTQYDPPPRDVREKGRNVE